MKKIFLSFIVCVILFIVNAKQTLAVYDSLSVPNNKIGIHILFPDELSKSRELVNSSNGDWGYVTIPIQAGDKDIKKWQGFMDNTRSLHLIPIVRLATEGDYFDKSSWRAPRDTDIVDFANFLNSLNWPTRNRYIIIFNEVNRGDEWKGQSDPARYAEILSYAVTVFKSKNQDFYIISAGLDNAASTTGNSYNEYDFMDLMNQSVPGIFNQIDGFSSHSYPNPGFSQPPSVNTRESVSSFIYEQELIQTMTGKKLPVFITETGWDMSKRSDLTISGYFKDALNNFWNDPSIVAITPFLLKSGPGPFEKFSFLKNNGDKTEIYKTIENLSKVKGKPKINPVKNVLGINEINSNIPVKDFSNNKEDGKEKELKRIVKWIILGW